MSTNIDKQLQGIMAGNAPQAGPLPEPEAPTQPTQPTQGMPSMPAVPTQQGGVVDKPTSDLDGMLNMLKKTEESQNDFPDVPDGDYMVEIKKATIGTTQTEPARLRVSIGYQVIDGAHTKQYIWDTLVLQTKVIDETNGGLKFNGIAKHQLNNIFRHFKMDPDSATFEYRSALKQIIGKTLTITKSSTEGTQLNASGVKPVFTNVKIKA